MKTEITPHGVRIEDDGESISHAIIWYEPETNVMIRIPNDVFEMEDVEPMTIQAYLRAILEKDFPR